MFFLCKNKKAPAYNDQLSLVCSGQALFLLNKESGTLNGKFV